jgi:hypothetical protein
MGEIFFVAGIVDPSLLHLAAITDGDYNIFYRRSL